MALSQLTHLAEWVAAILTGGDEIPKPMGSGLEL